VIWRQKNLATLTSDVRSRLVENLEAVLNAPKKQLSA
jgi:hypothetical protein